MAEVFHKVRAKDKIVVFVSCFPIVKARERQEEHS